MEIKKNITVTKNFSFDMGHRLRFHTGKCYGLHGHTYLLEVTVAGSKLTDEGFIIDFSTLKQLVNTILDDFDHKFLVSNVTENRNMFANIDDQKLINSIIYVDYEPTVENIGVDLFAKLDELLKRDQTVNSSIWLKKIKLYETPTSFAEITN